VAATLPSANFSIALVQTTSGTEQELCVGWIELPALAVAGGGTSVLLDTPATVRIASTGPGWATFANSLVASDLVTWRLRGGGGDTADANDPCSSSKLGSPQPYSRSSQVFVDFIGLMYPVTVTTDIAFQGLSGLKGVKLRSFSIPGESSDGTSLLISLDATLPNPSVVNLELNSTAQFASYFATSSNTFSYLGTVSTDSPLKLSKGSNHVKFQGQVHPTNLSEAGQFFTRYLKGDAQQVKVAGLGCTEAATCPTWINTLITTIAAAIDFPGSSSLRRAMLIMLICLLSI